MYYYPDRWPLGTCELMNCQCQLIDEIRLIIYIQLTESIKLVAYSQKLSLRNKPLQERTLNFAQRLSRKSATESFIFTELTDCSQVQK